MKLLKLSISESTDQTKSFLKMNVKQKEKLREKEMLLALNRSLNKNYDEFLIMKFEEFKQAAESKKRMKEVDLKLSDKSEFLRESLKKALMKKMDKNQ